MSGAGSRRSVRQLLPRRYGDALQRTFPLAHWDVERAFVVPQPGAREPGPYYVDWSGDEGPFGEGWNGAPFDPHGVILTPAGGAYHPVRIAQFGLAEHAAWTRSGDAAARARFLAQAAWVRDALEREPATEGALRYPFAVPAYCAEPGWLSAMAQGEAISLLLRAHADSPGRGFDTAAVAAAAPFKRTIDDTGVCRPFAGGRFYEEYATPLPSFVLNGFIYALWGLWELHRFGAGACIDALVVDGLATLRAVLARYDTGFWSSYDLVKPKMGPHKPASLAYHALHVAQLRVTAAMTGDAFFAAMAERWRGYQRSPSCRARYLAAALAYHGLRAVTRRAA